MPRLAKRVGSGAWARGTKGAGHHVARRTVPGPGAERSTPRFHIPRNDGAAAIDSRTLIDDVWQAIVLAPGQLVLAGELHTYGSADRL